MSEVGNQVGAVSRGLESGERAGQSVRTLTLSQTFPNPVDDVWDALTNPERIPRWFMPVTGSLVLGGRYQLEGNAGGEVLECDPLTRFVATWEYGEAISWIEVTLADDGPGTRVTLRHSASPDATWDEFGPGAVGIGWDMGVLGLALHLSSGGRPLPEQQPEWMATPEARDFMTASCAAWEAADVANGTPVAEAARKAAATLAAYTAPPA